MTFVGKILVIVIMAFALMFLGISTVVFTTANNWKEAATKEKQKVSDLQKKNSDSTAALDALKKDLDAAKKSADQVKLGLDNRLAALASEIEQIN